MEAFSTCRQKMFPEPLTFLHICNDTTKVSRAGEKCVIHEIFKHLSTINMQEAERRWVWHRVRVRVEPASDMSAHCTEPAKLPGHSPILRIPFTTQNIVNKSKKKNGKNAQIKKKRKMRHVRMSRLNAEAPITSHFNDFIRNRGGFFLTLSAGPFPWKQGFFGTHASVSTPEKTLALIFEQLTRRYEQQHSGPRSGRTVHGSHQIHGEWTCCEAVNSSSVTSQLGLRTQGGGTCEETERTQSQHGGNRKHFWNETLDWEY